MSKLTSILSVAAIAGLIGLDLSYRQSVYNEGRKASIAAICGTVQTPYRCNDVNNDGYLDLIREAEPDVPGKVYVFDPKHNTFEPPYSTPPLR